MENQQVQKTFSEKYAHVIKRNGWDITIYSKKSIKTCININKKIYTLSRSVPSGLIQGKSYLWEKETSCLTLPSRALFPESALQSPTPSHFS